jgi:hypothetical protein
MASGEAIESETTKPPEVESETTTPAEDASGILQSARGRVLRTLAAAKVPALAAGGVAVALAGVAVLMRRRRTKRVLGVKLPKALASKPSLDGASLVKQLGRASKQIGETSKAVSKDLDRLGDQAKRIGRFLE